MNLPVGGSHENPIDHEDSAFSPALLGLPDRQNIPDLPSFSAGRVA